MSLLCKRVSTCCSLAPLSGMDRLNELSKPPARRLSRNSEAESSDLDTGLRSSRKKVSKTRVYDVARRVILISISTRSQLSVFQLNGYQPARQSRDNVVSEKPLTHRSGTSLGRRIVRESRKMERWDILFFYFISTLYIYPPHSQESNEGAIHRVSNYPDLIPEVPRYCCPLKFFISVLYIKI